MKPKTISYSESKESFNISTGLKSWRKAGVEIELDGEGVEFAFEQAKEMVHDALREGETLNPNAVFTIGEYLANGNNVSLRPLPTIDTQKEKIEIAIDNCESLYELDLLMGDIAKHQLVPQYLEKKKSLK